MELIPNCSELVCRIDLKNISDLKNAGLQITKKGKNQIVYDKENNTSIELYPDDINPNKYVAQISDCEHKEFPTMQKISQISGRNVTGYDGGHTTSFDEFKDNKIIKLNMTQKESDKLLSYLVLDALNSTTLNTKTFTKYIDLPTGEEMYIPPREAKILKDRLSLVFPLIPKKDIFGNKYKNF